jgi:hypothetical protein
VCTQESSAMNFGFSVGDFVVLTDKAFLVSSSSVHLGIISRTEQFVDIQAL